MSAGTPTTTGLASTSRSTATWGRRLGIALLAVVVLAALSTALGVHTMTRTSSADGYRLTLRYPGIARAGLDVRWQARVEHPGGFGGPVTLALSGDYLSIYETQGFHPEPSSETRTAHLLLLTFDPPPGGVLVVDYDAYIQPASQHGKTGRLAVRVQGHQVAAVDFRTFLWP